MELSIRVLRAQTSAILRRVSAGETAVITSHRKPVARLVPAVPQGTGVDDLLIAAGLMINRPQPGPLVRGTGVGAAGSASSLSEAVLEDRG